MKVWVKFADRERADYFRQSVGKEARKYWVVKGPLECIGELTWIKTSRYHVEFYGLDIAETRLNCGSYFGNLLWPKVEFQFVRVEKDGKWWQLYSRCRHRHCDKSEIDRKMLGPMSARVMFQYRCRSCGYCFDKWEWE